MKSDELVMCSLKGLGKLDGAENITYGCIGKDIAPNITQYVGLYWIYYPSLAMYG